MTAIYDEAFKLELLDDNIKCLRLQLIDLEPVVGQLRLLVPPGSAYPFEPCLPLFVPHKGHKALDAPGVRVSLAKALAEQAARLAADGTPACYELATWLSDELTGFLEAPPPRPAKLLLTAKEQARQEKDARIGALHKAAAEAASELERQREREAAAHGMSFEEYLKAIDAWPVNYGVPDPVEVAALKARLAAGPNAATARAPMQTPQSRDVADIMDAVSLAADSGAVSPPPPPSNPPSPPAEGTPSTAPIPAAAAGGLAAAAPPTRDVASIIDGVVTAALPSRWHPDRTTSQRFILLCGETPHYRRIARKLTLADDVVLELGCSFGDCTAELAARARAVRAVDHSCECVERTAKRLPAVATHQLDVFGNCAQLVSLGQGCSSVFCDLNGNRSLSAAYVDLLLTIQERLRPSLLVVKCRALHEAALRAIGSTDEGGALPMSNWRFWADLRLGEAPRHDPSGPSAEDESGEVDPDRVPPDETRLCFTFTNKGRCGRAACTLRHLLPTHPEAIADAAKRSAIGWQPSRLRGRGVPDQQCKN